MSVAFILILMQLQILLFLEMDDLKNDLISLKEAKVTKNDENLHMWLYYNHDFLFSILMLS